MRAPFFWMVLLVIPVLAVPARAQVKGEKIVPGKAVVPTDGMRRLFGELVSIDLKTRTGTFRHEVNDEIMPFIVQPYAMLYHHAALGDLQDYKIGERALFRLHKNDEGKWVYLTYIQDEMNFMVAHKHYFRVDKLDPARGEIACTNVEAGKGKDGEGKSLVLVTDKETRYWKNGEPAKFADIQPGNKLRARTHGLGKGKDRGCWEVFLDDASLTKFQTEQRAIHAARLTKEGWPGYVDKSAANEVQITLFAEGNVLAKDLEPGLTVRIAPAGADRKAGKSVEGTLKSHQANRKLHQVTITLKSPPPEPFVVTGVARFWIVPK